VKYEVLTVSVITAFGCLLLAFIVLILKKKEKTPEIRTLGLLFGANAFYCLGYALELLTVSVGDKLLFNHIQYIGLPFIGPIWLLMCLQFCNKWRRTSWKYMLLLFLVPVITMALNFTHAENGLFYSSYRIIYTNGISAMVFTKGIWYYVEIINRSLLLATSAWLYAREMSGIKGMRKKQARYLLILSIIGLVLTAWSMMTPTTAFIDISCILLSIPFALISVTIFKHELFNLVPQAYSMLFDVLDQPILILSDKKTVIKANPEAKRVFARSLGGNRQPKLEDLFDGEERLDETGKLLYLYTPKNYLQYFSIKMIELDSLQNKNGDGYLAVLTDTTSHVEKIRSLKTLADGDPLTGLYNRRHFFAVSGEMLITAALSHKPVSLLIFDIDHFKNINDTFGHQAGDSVLRSISDSISHQLRSNDILARFGGDEFVLMLGTANISEAETVAQRICTTVRETKYTFEGTRIPITLSVGIGEGRASEFRNIDELMSLADKALYDAKTTGRNKVCINTQCPPERH
jgi:diguanylate cyclase (GGDEF)-like protein